MFSGQKNSKKIEFFSFYLNVAALQAFASHFIFSGNFFRSLWGTHAGWAQAALFVADIKISPKLYLLDAWSS